MELPNDAEKNIVERYRGEGAPGHIENLVDSLKKADFFRREKRGQKTSFFWRGSATSVFVPKTA